ncbi:hypothetical protein ACJIZ3_014796 [Penstemon smallii]|uniref:Ribosomal RNA-processing protein 7 C-terminal domain-containing protein n=1 Tax=Penstemon smallii TaxID=265156 RepID=A0ABD3RKR6_9LAMI
MEAEGSLRKLKRKISRKKKREQTSDGDGTQETREGSKKNEKLKNKKTKEGTISKTEICELVITHSTEVEDQTSNKRVAASEPGKNKLQKSKKNKRTNIQSIKNNEFNKEEDVYEQGNDEDIASVSACSKGLNEADTRRRSKTGKSKRAAKMKNNSGLLANGLTQNNLLEKREEAAEDQVYEMSSGDEDYSKGMQKWIMQYHQSRPGLKVLQEKIDDFIMAHEAKEEQARKEREAQAAEGGWTVVVQHKGRKKTTEAESGIAVGSVAQAAVLDKMAKKKNKDVGLDFYRFQKREAHRSEIMMLQSKFEQDKKRIQQMRASRKFRPY